MPGSVRVGGSWKTVPAISTRVSGSWKTVTNGWVRVAGAWKQFFTSSQPALVHLQTVTLSSPTNAVEFTNLVSQYASTYQHLQLRYVTRQNEAGNGRNESGGLRFNGVTSNSYSWHTIVADEGSGVRNFGAANNSYMLVWVVSPNGLNSAYGVGVIDILDPFETSKNKTIRVTDAATNTSNNYGRYVGVTSGAFYSTNQVSSIRFFLGVNNFAPGSRFSLFGVKAQ